MAKLSDKDARLQKLIMKDVLVVFAGLGSLSVVLLTIIATSVA